MSSSRDLDRRIVAYLDPGPDALPDWVLASVAAQIHGTPQSGRLTKRLGGFTVLAGYIAAAVVVAVVASWWLALPSAPDLGGPVALPAASGHLEAGQAYQSEGFSLPLTFRLPAESGGAEADLLDGHSLRLRPSAGGAITLHHDAALADDLCHPAGLVNDLDTVADVRMWLRSSAGVALGPERQLSLPAGRSAVAWDIGLADDCWASDQGEVGEVVWLAAGETPRVYAIPLDGDVVVGITWAAGDGPQADFTQITTWADALVQSMARANGR